MKEDLDYIVDVMNGADGGLKFVRLRMFLQDEKVQDNPRVKLLVRGFANMIRIVNDEDPVND